MAYTAAHTGYIPFNSDAPRIFSLQRTDNYLTGKWFFGHREVSHFCVPVISFVHSHLKLISLLMLMHWHSPGSAAIRSSYHSGYGGRRFLPDYTIITLEMFRFPGFGRSSKTFNPTGYALTLYLRLRWRLPKGIFIVNRYIITLLLMHVICNTLHLICDVDLIA
jgi:hypothetical protein